MPNNDTENIYSTPYEGGEGNPIPATKISYDNTDSGLTATTAQGAIDELAGAVDDLTAADVAYDNTDSGFVATNVQGAIDEIAEKKFRSSTLWSGDASTAGSVVVSDLSQFDALMIYYNSGNGSGIIPYDFFKTHAIKVNYTDGTNVTSASATYVDDTHITLGASQGSTVFIIGIKFNA